MNSIAFELLLGTAVAFGLLAGVLITLILPLGYWLWLTEPTPRLRTTEGSSNIKFYLIQVSAILVLVDMSIRTTPLSVFLFPPVGLISYLVAVAKYHQLLVFPVAGSTIATALVGVISWKMTRRNRYPIWPATSALFFCGTTLFLAGWTSTAAQNKAIKNLRPDCLLRSSFLHSISIAGNEFQPSYHVIAFKDEKPFGWSYAEMGFYALPWQAAINLDNATELFQQCYRKKLNVDAIRERS